MAVMRRFGVLVKFLHGRKWKPLKLIKDLTKCEFYECVLRISVNMKAEKKVHIVLVF